MRGKLTLDDFFALRDLLVACAFKVTVYGQTVLVCDPGSRCALRVYRYGEVALESPPYTYAFPRIDMGAENRVQLLADAITENLRPTPKVEERVEPQPPAEDEDRRAIVSGLDNVKALAAALSTAADAAAAEARYVSIADIRADADTVMQQAYSAYAKAVQINDFVAALANAQRKE